MRNVNIIKYTQAVGEVLYRYALWVGYRGEVDFLVPLAEQLIVPLKLRELFLAEFDFVVLDSLC